MAPMIFRVMPTDFNRRDGSLLLSNSNYDALERWKNPNSKHNHKPKPNPYPYLSLPLP